MKKRYEKPEIEMVSFEMPENIMTETYDAGIGSGSPSIDEGVDWD